MRRVIRTMRNISITKKGITQSIYKEAENQLQASFFLSFFTTSVEELHIEHNCCKHKEIVKVFDKSKLTNTVTKIGTHWVSKIKAIRKSIENEIWSVFASELEANPLVPAFRNLNTWSIGTRTMPNTRAPTNLQYTCELKWVKNAHSEINELNSRNETLETKTLNKNWRNFKV